MASNPPINSFHANGSFDLQTRINRFLTTIEPHTRFFTAQGRMYLDSLIERDKKEDRALKADKTGWAVAGFERATTLADVAYVGEDGAGSGKSVTAMSSVSQRGGIRARMRDRYGNTSAMITAVRSVKLSKTETKTKSKEKLVNALNTSSSSPIKPWKDIRPKSSVEAESTPKVLLKPVVEIPIYSTNGTRGDEGMGDDQHMSAETSEKATSRKRKASHNDTISAADDGPTSLKQGKFRDDAKDVPTAKKLKVKPAKEAESRRRPLGESSALNSTRNRGSRKETCIALSERKLRSKASVEGSDRQRASQKAEEQAREESGS